MEERIQAWLDSALASSQLQLQMAQALPQIHSQDWDATFAQSLQDANFARSGGILLSGTDDYSKRCAAVQLVQRLQAQAYEGVLLEGAELTDEGAREAKARIDGLLDHFYDAGQGLCLVLEGMEECACRREVLSFLGQKLCEYRMYQQDLTPLFLLLLDDREQQIPGLLRSCLRQHRLQLPNQAQRMGYLEKNAKSLRNFMSFAHLSQITEGVSYAQLQDVIEWLECYIDSRDGRELTDAELSELLEGQMPAAAGDNGLQSLSRSVQQLVEQLPELLQSIPAPQVQAMPMQQMPQTAAAQSIPVNEEQHMSEQRKMIEEMAPIDLCTDLFGQERTAGLMQKAEQIMQ